MHTSLRSTAIVTLNSVLFVCVLGLIGTHCFRLPRCNHKSTISKKYAEIGRNRYVSAQIDNLFFKKKKNKHKNRMYWIVHQTYIFLDTVQKYYSRVRFRECECVFLVIKFFMNNFLCRIIYIHAKYPWTFWLMMIFRNLFSIDAFPSHWTLGHFATFKLESIVFVSFRMWMETN